jgi:hypothetical protein
VLHRGAGSGIKSRKDDSMNSQITGLRVASVVFGLMAIASIAAASDASRGARAGASDAVVAKRAGLHHFERSECLVVETRSHADQMNEPGTNTPNGPMLFQALLSGAAELLSLGMGSRLVRDSI